MGISSVHQPIRDPKVEDRAARHTWFKSTILPHESALRRQVRRMAASSRIDIDDIVSETLTRAYTTEGYARIDNGRSFLFTVARNLMTDLARRRAVIPFELMANLENFNLSDPAPSPEAAAMARDELHRLQQVVDSLPAQCRQVFLLRRIDEISLQGIAVRLGLSVSTIEKHLSRAMALLNQGMAEGEPPPTERKGLKWQRTKDNP